MKSHSIYAVKCTELYPVYEVNDDSQLPADLVARAHAALTEFNTVQSLLEEYQDTKTGYDDCGCIFIQKWGRQTQNPVCYCQRIKHRSRPTPQE